MDRALFVAAAALFAHACIVPAPSRERSAEKKRPLSPTSPPLTVSSGANLGGKVEIISATIQPGEISPGDQARVTVFFKVLDKLDRDYIVFVHVEDADGRMEQRMNVDHPPAGGAYPTTAWKKGETVRDDFSIYLPPGAPTRGLNIWMGLWEPSTDTRLPLRNPEAVRNDGRDRILLARLPVSS